MNLRNAQPIVDYNIRKFINSINTSDFLYDQDIANTFSNNFYDWIDSSTNNNLKGLDSFTNRKVISGSIQAFDHWYWKHKDRTVKFFKGEFMYHQACLKNGGKFAFIEDSKLSKNDAVVISVPFSDWGKQRSDLKEILYNCTGLGIPVLLDFAYYPCAKNIELDLCNFKCIDTIAFSISKAFYGAEFLRIGMRLEKHNSDDGIDVYNSVDMHNRVALGIANQLITNYSVDYNWNTYRNEYSQVCADHNLLETDCIMFGTGEQWKEMNRGTAINRVCVSQLIGEILASTK